MDSTADIAAALAAMSERELHALREQLDSETVVVQGLLSWLKRAIDWETGRRAGSCNELPGPRAAIGSESDVECSLVVLALLQAQLRGIIGAARFLDATADALCAFHAAGPSGVH